VHSDGTSLLFSLSFSITRCVRCASIRPAIKRYISSLAIDFRAPSPSLLLRSLRARRNPLRQLTFRLPPHDADLLASRRRRLTRFALGPLRAKPFPTIARPARRDATHFRRPMGAISLSLVALDPTKSEVIPLGRAVTRDARREILYRLSPAIGESFRPRTGFFYIVAKNLGKNDPRSFNVRERNCGTRAKVTEKR